MIGRRFLVTGLGILAALLAVSAPALAECPGQPNVWPSFRQVAPSARSIVVGTVENTLTRDASPVFDLRIDEVLRGSSPSMIHLSGLKSGAPLIGGPACQHSAYLYARRGDVIAIAYQGRAPGISGRVTTAAWIEGRPYVLDPGAERLTLVEVRRLAVLPDTSTALIGSVGSTAPTSPLLEPLALVSGLAVGGWLTLRLRSRPFPGTRAIGKWRSRSSDRLRASSCVSAVQSGTLARQESGPTRSLSG